MHEQEAGSVRTYLMQIGDIPLFTRAEEMAAARRISVARRQYRRSVLTTDYVLRALVERCGRFTTDKSAWTVWSRWA